MTQPLLKQESPRRLDVRKEKAVKIKINGETKDWPKEKVYKTLEENGITETTGCSEAFPDGWVRYAGEDGFEIMVKEMAPQGCPE